MEAGRRRQCAAFRAPTARRPASTAAPTSGGEGRAPDEAPLVVQVSRWDRLKDHIGVMRAFAGLEATEAAGAHLVLAGPAVTAVADDPDGPAVLAELHGRLARPAARRAAADPDRQPADG